MLRAKIDMRILDSKGPIASEGVLDANTSDPPRPIEIVGYAGPTTTRDETRVKFDGGERYSALCVDQGPVEGIPQLFPSDLRGS